MRIPFWWLVYSCSNLSAQTILPGQVSDSLGFPLVDVQIYILSNPDSTLISRQLTGQRGEFKLQFQKPGSYQIQFQRLAYQTAIIPLNVLDFPEQILDKLYITLQERPLTLPEVIVNSQRPIRVLKDTVEIGVKPYLSGGERVAEDVLSQLPGLEIDANGGIRVRGKPVSKVLIEGDNLFDNQYTLLTRNLDAQTIDKVQVLYNYTDNPVLKGIQDNRAIALNISLKPEVRNTFFGQTEVGGGAPELYTLRPNLINVRKATKTYFLGNLNNIGVSVKGDVRYQNEFLGNLENTYLGDLESLESLSESFEWFANPEGNRSKLNQSGLGSLSGVINPLPNLKLQGQTSLNTDSNTAIRNRIESFESDGLRFNTSEFRKSESGFREGNYQFVLRFSPKNKNLEWETHGNQSNWQQTDNLKFNSRNLHQGQSVKNSKSDNRLTFTQRWNTSNAIQLNLRKIDEFRGLKTRLDTILWTQLPIADLKADTIRQSANQALDFTSMHAKLWGKQGNWNWKLHASILSRHTEMISQLSAVDGAVGEVALPAFSNRVMSRMLQSSLGVELNYGRKAWKFHAGLERNTFHNHYQDNGTGHMQTRKWIPDLGLEWNPNRQHSVFARYTYSVNETGIVEWFQGYLLSGYRGLSSGGGWYAPYRAHNALMGYTLGEWGNSFQLRANAMYRNEPRYLGIKLEMMPQYQLTENIEFKNRQNATLSIRADRYFKKLHGNLNTKVNVQSNNYEIVLNQNQSNIQTSFIDFGPEWRTLFNRGINLHLGYSFKFSTTFRERTQRLRNQMGFFDLNVQAGNRWFFEFSNEMHKFWNTGSKSCYWLSDLLIRFAADPGKPSYRLELDNLLNVRTFSNRNILDTGYFETQTALRPRSILFTVNFKI